MMIRFVTTTTAEGRITRRLASYRTKGAGDLANCTKIWEAGRATSAATSFFDPAVIGPYGEKFLDGGTGANNPINSLWNEAKSVWPTDALEVRILCIVSIGTGLSKYEAFGEYPHEIPKSLMDIAMDTEKTAQDFHAGHNDLVKKKVYHRFNVSRGLEVVELDEISKVSAIASATRSYLGQTAVQNDLEDCASKLKERKGSSASSVNVTS